MKFNVKREEKDSIMTNNILMFSFSCWSSIECRGKIFIKNSQKNFFRLIIFRAKSLNSFVQSTRETVNNDILVFHHSFVKDNLICTINQFFLFFSVDFKHRDWLKKKISMKLKFKLKENQFESRKKTFQIESKEKRDVNMIRWSKWIKKCVSELWFLWNCSSNYFQRSIEKKRRINLSNK